MPFSLSLYTSKRRSLKFLLSRHGCPVWPHLSLKHLETSRLDLQRWNRISVPSLHVCANSRHMLPQHQMFPVRQDPGLHSNKLAAPQPQGPMAQGHLMTIRNTRRRLDPFSSAEDERPRSAVLLQFPCEQYLKGITQWIDTLWVESGSWHVTNLLEFIAKQVLCQSDLFLKHEANVKTLLSALRMMAFFEQSTVPSAAPILLSQCVNPDQLKSERSEDNLCRCGKNWLTNLKFFFLMHMTKEYSSSPRSTLDPKSSASKIAETALENQFSNLLHWVADKHLCLLHLICLFLVFRMRCYNGSLSSQQGLMCDGRSLASPFLPRLAGRGAFFGGFLIR